MIRTCKNCAGRLTYDIEKKGLSCANCGSLFKVEDYDTNPYSGNDNRVFSISSKTPCFYLY